MGSLCLFTRQQALKMGYFYWLRVKRSNHLHTELNLGYLKGTKFYLESKASFIDISSIASFKPFLIAWLQEYCTFSDSSELTWSTRLGQNTPSWEPFFKNNHVLRWNPDFSNPRFHEPPDISNQILFPLDLLHSSSTISPPISRTLNFSKLPITQTNFGSRGTNWPSIPRTCENFQILLTYIN